MASVSSALSRIKQDLQLHLSPAQIESACVKAGHHWRERKFGPVLTIHLFILQVLNFNTAIRHLRLLAKMPINAAAYCRARMRLPLDALQELLRISAATMAESMHREVGGKTRWTEHRTFLLDATSTITPDTRELRKVFEQPTGQKKGCGFPVPKVLGLIDACTGLIVEMMAFALYVHEQSKVWLLHPLLKAGDLVVGDRGFCSFVHVAMLLSRDVLCVFRMHQRQIVNFRSRRKSRSEARIKRKGLPSSVWVKRLGKHDQLVKWRKPGSRPAWMSRQQFDALPQEVLVRELRYTLASKGQRSHEVTIATTLLDPVKYSKESIAELYGIRWRIETHWGELKTTLKMRKIKCRTEAGVRKELAAYALVFNLVHGVMMRAALRQKVPPERISFVDALRWLLNATPGEELVDLVINPHRPDRHEPRVIKDLQDTYYKMTKPRHVPRRKLELAKS